LKRIRSTRILVCISVILVFAYICWYQSDECKLANKFRTSRP
jgi:hypothetical protein